MEPQTQSPPWVFSLLAGQFFVPCSIHADQKKKEKNIFCLDCCASICLHCRQHLHSSHRFLRIRRYVYNDVVAVEDCEKLFDCEFIQAYVTNHARVVYLNQRPQSRHLNASGYLCISCERNIPPAHKFCSLACKVEYLVQQERMASSSSSGGASGAGLALYGPPPCTAATEDLVSLNERAGGADTASAALTSAISDLPRSVSDKPHLFSPRRKGVPCRSPFF